MIDIQQLTKDYGSFRAVDSLSLNIPDGQILGLLGPNGAGKTTTLRILTGYLPPTAGSVKVCGFDTLTESNSVRTRLGYLPESNPLYPEMRVDEYLHFRGRLFNISHADRKKAVERVLSRCWLSEMRGRLIGRLSKGYKQRVGLAAALLHSPPVLILDEPTSGLDPMQIRETRKLIRELAGEHTMILSSHILPEIEVTCDRIVILAQGKKRADGTISQLRQLAGEEASYIFEMRDKQDVDFAKILKSKAEIEIANTIKSGGWIRYEISVKGSHVDLRETIGLIIQEHKILCRELSRETVSLEQLFIRVTSESSGHTNTVN